MSSETCLLRIDYRRVSFLRLILSFNGARDPVRRAEFGTPRKSSAGLLVLGHDICVLVQQANVWNAREYRGPSVRSLPALTLLSRMLASARASALTCKTS